MTSLRELQRARQESRSLRDVAFMYGSTLKDQEMLVKHIGAGWILPKSGFGPIKPDGTPAASHAPGTLRVVYPYPVLANDKAETFARCGLTPNDMLNNHIIVYPQQRLWRRPVGVKNDVERQDGKNTYAAAQRCILCRNLRNVSSPKTSRCPSSVEGFPSLLTANGIYGNGGNQRAKRKATLLSKATERAVYSHPRKTKRPNAASSLGGETAQIFNHERRPSIDSRHSGDPFPIRNSSEGSGGCSSVSSKTRDSAGESSGGRQRGIRHLLHEGVEEEEEAVGREAEEMGDQRLKSGDGKERAKE